MKNELEDASAVGGEGKVVVAPGRDMWHRQRGWRVNFVGHHTQGGSLISSVSLSPTEVLDK